MASSCCGGGRCYCRLVEGANVTITGTGEADNPYEISSTGGGGGSDHFYYAEDYGTITDGGDNLAVIQEMVDDAAANGGGTWVIWRRYTWEGLLILRGGVAVYCLALPQLEIPGETEIGLKAIGPTAKVQWGVIPGSGSHDDNPGEIRNLFVDGDGVGGDGDALFICDAANSPIYNLNVRRSANHGVDIGSSQNLTIYNLQSGEHHNGTALLFKSRSLGRIGPCGNKVYGGHVGDSYLPIHVTANGAGDFFPPNNNIVEGVLFETGRMDEDATIRCNGVFEAGETMLRSCLTTAGTHLVTNEEDCCFLIDNPHFTGYSTILTLDSCYLGGGAGTVKATDAVRVLQTSAFNEVRFYGRTQVANLDYLICADGLHFGAGSDLVASVDGSIGQVTPLTAMFRGINSGTFTGIISQRYNPLRLIGQSGLGNLLQIRRDTDTGNRLQIDRDGNIKMGPGDGSLPNAILNGPLGMSLVGENVMQVLAVTTAIRLALAPATYIHRFVFDTDLGITFWSDGTSWLSSLDSKILGYSERTVTGSVANNTTVTVDFTTNVETDIITYSAGVFTCTKAGVYTVSAGCQYNANVTGRRLLQVRKNGAVVPNGVANHQAPPAGGGSLMVAPTFRCAAGDTIDVQTVQNSGGALSGTFGVVIVNRGS